MQPLTKFPNQTLKQIIIQILEENSMSYIYDDRKNQNPHEKIKRLLTSCPKSASEYKGKCWESCIRLIYCIIWSKSDLEYPLFVNLYVTCWSQPTRISSNPVFLQTGWDTNSHNTEVLFVSTPSLKSLSIPPLSFCILNTMC